MAKYEKIKAMDVPHAHLEILKAIANELAEMNEIMRKRK